MISHCCQPERSRLTVNCDIPVICANSRLEKLILTSWPAGDLFSPSRRMSIRLLGEKRSPAGRSEEHTSELQSHSDLVCRLLLEKKKKNGNNATVNFTY